MINNNILPYFRKDTSGILIFSAAIALMLLASPVQLLPFSNPLLLQPVQAQTTLSFKTPTPVDGYDPPTGQEVALTFAAQGTTSTSEPLRADITNGTIQLQADPSNNGKIYPGKINNGFIDKRTGAGFINFDATINNTDYTVQSFCSTSENNDITVKTGGGQTETDFYGPIECSSSQGGGDTTTQSSSSSSVTGTTTTQDKDGDGILDANDNCPNLPNTRCYKEGDTALVVHNRNR
ncbi:MAG: thrombospondin type 3 repeat-containing protein [Nitrososphaera sp.]